MNADKHKTHLCAHIQQQGPEVHTFPEGVTEALKQMIIHAHTNKSSHKSLTYIQQTLNIFTLEQV